MKKKILKPAAKAKPTRRLSRSKTGSASQTVVFQRIVIISACITVAILGVIFFNKPKVERAVAGATVTRGLFMQSTIAMPGIAGATGFNIYYRPVGDKTFPHAVRKIPTSVSTYTISFLKKGVRYEYKIAAINSAGKEFLWSEIKPLTDLKAM